MYLVKIELMVTKTLEFENPAAFIERIFFFLNGENKMKFCVVVNISLTIRKI